MIILLLEKSVCCFYQVAIWTAESDSSDLKMRLSRYVSRRCWRLLQYVIIGAMVVLMVPVLVSYSSSKSYDGGSYHDKNDNGHVMPGFHVAPDKEKEVRRAIPDAALDINGGDPFEKYKNLPKKDWHDYKEMEEDAKRKGPGEQGT